MVGQQETKAQGSAKQPPDPAGSETVQSPVESLLSLLGGLLAALASFRRRLRRRPRLTDRLTERRFLAALVVLVLALAPVALAVWLNVWTKRASTPLATSVMLVAGQEHPEGHDRFPRAHAGSVTAAAFSPDGAYIVTGGTDGVIRSWSHGGGLLREAPAPWHQLQGFRFLRIPEIDDRDLLAIHASPNLLAGLNSPFENGYPDSAYVVREDDLTFSISIHDPETLEPIDMEERIRSREAQELSPSFGEDLAAALLARVLEGDVRVVDGGPTVFTAVGPRPDTLYISSEFLDDIVLYTRLADEIDLGVTRGHPFSIVASGPEDRLAAVNGSGKVLLFRFVPGAGQTFLSQQEEADLSESRLIYEAALGTAESATMEPQSQLPLRASFDPDLGIVDGSSVSEVSSLLFLPQTAGSAGSEASIGPRPVDLLVMTNDQQALSALAARTAAFVERPTRLVALPPEARTPRLATASPGSGSIVTAYDGGALWTWPGTARPYSPDNPLFVLDPFEGTESRARRDDGAGPVAQFLDETPREIRGLVLPFPDRLYAAVPEGLIEIPPSSAKEGPSLLEPTVAAEFFSLAAHAGTGLVAGGYHRQPTTIGGIAIWRPGQNRALLAEIDEEGRGLAFSLAFSPAGDRLAAGFRDGSVVMYGEEESSDRPDSWQRLWAMSAPHGAAARRVGFSPDGQLVVNVTDGTAIRFHNAADGLLLAELDKGAEASGKGRQEIGLTISEDGTRLAESSGSGFRVWDLGRLRTKIDAVREAESRAVPGDVVCAACIKVAYLPAGLLTVDGGGRVRLWSPDSGRPVQPATDFTLPLAPLQVVVLGPDRDRLALARPDGTVAIRELRSGDLLMPLIEGLHGEANLIAASEDGQHLLIGGFDGGARRVDLARHARLSGLDVGHALHAWTMSILRRYLSADGP